MEGTKRRTVLTLVLHVTFFCQLLFVDVVAARSLGPLVYQKDSLYHRIFVYRNGPVVTLQFGKRSNVQMQSQANLDDLRENMLEYTNLAFSGLLYKPEPERILVLGLGGGVIPREMHHYLPALEIDVVEIDPEIPPIASGFFGFREDDKLRVQFSQKPHMADILAEVIPTSPGKKPTW